MGGALLAMAHTYGFVLKPGCMQAHQRYYLDPSVKFILNLEESCTNTAHIDSLQDRKAASGKLQETLKRK
jgi:hypothetical protein